MGKLSNKLGWLIAAAIALGWYGSGRETTSPPQSATAQKAATPVVPPPAMPEASPLPFYTAPSTRTEPEERLFVTRKVKLRKDATTAAQEVATLPVGSQVVAFGHRGNWRSVRFEGTTGWVASRYLSASEPTPAAKPAQVVSRRVTAPTGSPSRSGQPVRQPMVGRCDCPYDLMRNGRLCGGRSAYSRPGGRSPACYW